jgi:hypothetical protein
VREEERVRERERERERGVGGGAGERASEGRREKRVTFEDACRGIYRQKSAKGAA